MRIVLLIVMVLAMLVATGMGFLVGQKNLLSDEAKALEALTPAAEAVGGSEFAELAGGIKKSGYGGFTVGALALLTAILAFAKASKPLTAVGGATVVASIAFIVICTGAKPPGMTSGASPKQQAMVYGIAAIVAAGAAIGADKMRKPNA